MIDCRHCAEDSPFRGQTVEDKQKLLKTLTSMKNSLMHFDQTFVASAGCPETYPDVLPRDVRVIERLSGMIRHLTEHEQIGSDPKLA